MAVIANANHELMFPVKETMQVDAETNRKDAPQFIRRVEILPVKPPAVPWTTNGYL